MEIQTARNIANGLLAVINNEFSGKDQVIFRCKNINQAIEVMQILDDEATSKQVGVQANLQDDGSVTVTFQFSHQENTPSTVH